MSNFFQLNQKNFLIYICVLLNTHLLFSQSVHFEWAKEFASNRVYGSEVSMAIDSKKNVYSTGLFTGTADFDPSPGVFNLTALNIDLFISKLDSNGNFIWAKRIAGNTETVPYSIAIDALDNLYFTGHFSGTTDFDPNIGIFNLTASSHDVFICKLNSSGNFVFAKKFSASFGFCCDYARSIVVDKYRNIYTCGRFNSTVDFDPNAGSYNLTANSDIFISKLDSNGNFIWAKQMGGSGIDEAFSITLDRSGNILTAGSFQGTADFDPSLATYNLTSVSSQDIFVSKLNPNGNFMWAKRFGGGGNFFDNANSIAVDTIGNVFTTGLFFGTADFDPGPGVYNINSPGISDVFISKLDSNGNFVWVKNMGNGGNVVGTSICTDLSGNVYTTGYYSNNVDFDPGFVVFYLYGTNLNSNTFISKLNKNGDFVFAKSFWNNSNVSQPIGTEIKIDSKENLYIGGYYKGTPDFDPNLTTYTLTSPSFDNSFVVKLNSCTLPNAPTITIPPANLTLCAGNSATLSATSSGMLNWYNDPLGTILLYSGYSVITPALYFPFYTIYAQAYTCDASPMTPVTFTINPAPTIIVNNGSICQGNSFTMTPVGAYTYTFSSGSPIVSPISNTTYTIIGTSINGCLDTTMCGVFIFPSPTITVNNGAICSGNSFTMTPTGAYTYTFSSGSAVVSPTSNTTYSITGASWQGCLGSNIALSSVTVNPSPTVMIISTSSLLCIGNTATLSASGALNYIWSTGSNLQDIIVSPPITTSYSVTGFNSFLCSNTNSIAQNISACSGVNKFIKSEESVIIYPNPMNDKLYVEVSKYFDTAKIEIYNATGELVLKQILYKSQSIVDPCYLSNGLYFAKITIDNENIFIQKIVKQ